MSFWGDAIEMVRRATLASTGPQQLIARLYPGGYQAPPKRGTREMLLAYSEMPWLRAVVGKVAQTISAVEWALYQDTPGTPPQRGPRGGDRYLPPRRRSAVRRLKTIGDVHRRAVEIDWELQQETLEQLDDHPILHMVRGSRSVTPVVLWKLLSIHYDLVGEGYWALERNRAGVAIEPWPVPPSWVIGLPTPLFPNYRVSYRGWQVDIPQQDMLVFRDPDPENPYGRGSGVAMALGDELDTDEYSSKFIKQFYSNSARPDAIIGFETASEESISEVEKKWNALHRGFAKAFRTSFMNGKFSVHEFTTNFRNLQMIPLRQFERDAIITVYGVPPEKLGVLQASNRSTIDASDLIMAKDVAVPRLEAFRAQLQLFIDLEWGPSYFITYKSPVREDREFHLKAAQAQPSTVSWDEWRCLQGLPPSPDKQLGAMVLMAGGVTLVDPVEAMNPPAPEPPSMGGPPGVTLPAERAALADDEARMNGHSTAWDLTQLSTDDLLRLRELAEKADAS